MFYIFLSKEDKYKGVEVGQYHVIADNRDIKRWQISRQVKRLVKQKVSPKSETIFNDAKMLLTFFNWLIESYFITCVKVEKTTWQAQFNNRQLLNYIRKKAKLVIDNKNINVLDKESRQKSKHSLITDKEIISLMQSFNDPVYSIMFNLSLGTAMRPMDLCAFPYIGNGENKHIFNYSDLGVSKGIIFYWVSNSKGAKTRKIQINVLDLKTLEDNYIKPFYNERAELYKKRFGKNCPPSILFLNKVGKPITPEMISSRSNDAKKMAIKNNSDFREKVIFYDARHWWPTIYLIKFFGEKLLTDHVDVLYAAAVEVLTAQMGHNDIETTWDFYIDKAIILMMANLGIVNDIARDSDETVESFINKPEIDIKSILNE
jgi:integrase